MYSTAVNTDSQTDTHNDTKKTKNRKIRKRLQLQVTDD